MQVINPSQPATLSCSVQTYNKISWLKTGSFQNLPSSNNHTYYLSPATFKPDTFAIKSHRRSPNKPTKQFNLKSSCSVHGPFRIPSCTIFVSFPYSASFNSFCKGILLHLLTGTWTPRCTLLVYIYNPISIVGNCV